MTAESRARADSGKTEGSQEWFDDHWQAALQEGRYLYPKAVPTTQWELFEREKAVHIDRLLDEKRILEGLVLECGCGTAGMSVYLANKGFPTIATDISPAALKLAQLNAEENRTASAPANLHLLAADVFSLPLPDDAFDLVMSHGLLEHFDSQSLRAVMPEMVRVLRPGGLFVADISHGGFSVRKVARWLNLPVSLGYYLCRADFSKLRLLWRAHFDGFYENSLNAEQWADQLEMATLCQVQVKVMRPFPPFALTPSIGRMYVGLMERLLGFWRRFDRSQSWLTRRWGWLYLAYGTKPSDIAKGRDKNWGP